MRAITTVTNIAAGGTHSFFIQSDGSLWAMGYNTSGQLGDGTFSIAPTSRSRSSQAASSLLPAEASTVCS